MQDLILPHAEVQVRERRWGGWRPGAGRPRRTDWQEDFLRAFGRLGKRCHAAYEAGVDRDTVAAELGRDPDFAAQFDEANEYYDESIEQRMEDQAAATGNPVGYIVRLKARKPHQYIEKALTLNISTSVELAKAGDVLDVLRAVLQGSVTDTTLRAITEGRTDDTHDTRPAREADGREDGESRTLSLPPANAREGQAEIPRALPPA